MRQKHTPYHWTIQRALNVAALFRRLRRFVKVTLFYQVVHSIRGVAEPNPTTRRKARILAVIAHITPDPATLDEARRAIYVDRLKHTIDGLLVSFAVDELAVVIQSQPGRHITSDLPSYQLDHITIDESSTCDPMFIGFEAQTEFAKRRNEFDWFLYLEDDIVITDGYFIGKLERFNLMSGNESIVLLPHRYELWEGIKRYIDLAMDDDLQWSRLTPVVIDGIRFGECTNPHSGLYCLSAKQLQKWLRSPQDLNRRNLFAGPRESASTFSLMECFHLYKPHPSNIGIFEVQHFDTKYSQLDRDINPEYSMTAWNN